MGPIWSFLTSLHHIGARLVPISYQKRCAGRAAIASAIDKPKLDPHHRRKLPITGR